MLQLKNVKYEATEDNQALDATTEISEPFEGVVYHQTIEDGLRMFVSAPACRRDALDTHFDNPRPWIC